MSQFSGKITAACDHVRDVCRKCVARTVDLEVNGKGNSTRILCPHPQCEGELAHADVKREARKHVFERFDRLLFQEYLQGLSGFQGVLGLALILFGWGRCTPLHQLTRPLANAFYERSETCMYMYMYAFVLFWR